MAATRDWESWHGPYDDESSALSRRLRIIQGHISEWMDETAPAPVSVVSCCAGDGRDLLQVLASRDDAGRVRATLLEFDPRNVQRAEGSAMAADLDAFAVTCVDAGVSDAYVGAVPADLVLLCGVFGNIDDDDVQRLVRALPQLCTPDALVVWTCHRGEPDLTPTIRRWLVDADFEELSFTAPDDVAFSVGLHRFVGKPVALEPGARLFSFVR